jgi:hypothetical protein
LDAARLGNAKIIGTLLFKAIDVNIINAKSKIYQPVD